jgi:flagellar basal-body rod protein FlgB
MRSLFEPHLDIAGKAMDLRLQRQNVVMSNIANLRTPGYQAKRVEFEKELQAAVGQGAEGEVTRTDAHHMPVAFDLNTFEGRSAKNVTARVVHGEDRVDLDKEMATMAKNALNYNALVTIVQKNLEGVRTVITEGGR